MTLRCLFIDFDSFFASVEQHDAPHLRGRPVAVIPVASDATCCIAASKEAKLQGVKTGTGVREAAERIPDIVFQLARPARYVQIHHQFLDAIQQCIPHGAAGSIDEVPCWLIGRERQRDNAIAIARSIKQKLVDVGIGPSMTCSIGIAPNKFLAKTGSDMNKPDGLTVIEQADLPGALHGLDLRDLCGIGPSMEQRLRNAGIQTVQQLCASTRKQLRRAWGSIEGERFWLQLQGFDLPERETRRSSIGHSHVLGPELRNFASMRSVLFKLLAKAAMRLRDEEFLAAGMAIRVRFVGMEARFDRDLRFAPLDDTPALLQILGRNLEVLARDTESGRWQVRRHPPLSVAITLTRLEPRSTVCGQLMDERLRSKAASVLLDRVNRKYGNNTLYMGAMADAVSRNAAPMRIPFQHVPELALEEETALHCLEQTPTTAADLLQVRMNQFRVLAEKTHRERTIKHKSAGAGSWETAKQLMKSPQRSLF
ncbi:hypothetical protein [Thermomonas sp.]|uniref:DNA polymerase Y family protein n=1 Tax=Thermomonas sp. TaxID=1971895 RepID=UPI0024870E34|nr:hypothetical protein [Thermomonas sp.]MDI1251721.1 hypothetical protein [Thermomonas sp.]